MTQEGKVNNPVATCFCEVMHICILEGNLVTLGNTLKLSERIGEQKAPSCGRLRTLFYVSLQSQRIPNGLREWTLCQCLGPWGQLCSETLNSHSNPTEGERIPTGQDPLEGGDNGHAPITPALHPEQRMCLPRPCCHQGRSPAPSPRPDPLPSGRVYRGSLLLVCRLDEMKSLSDCSLDTARISGTAPHVLIHLPRSIAFLWMGISRPGNSVL